MLSLYLYLHNTTRKQTLFCILPNTNSYLHKIECLYCKQYRNPEVCYWTKLYRYIFIAWQILCFDLYIIELAILIPYNQLTVKKKPAKYISVIADTKFYFKENECTNAEIFLYVNTTTRTLKILQWHFLIRKKVRCTAISQTSLCLIDMINSVCICVNYYNVTYYLKSVGIA